MRLVNALNGSETGAPIGTEKRYRALWGATQIAWNWAVILGCLAATEVCQSIAASVMAIIVIGVHLHRLALLGHEGTHYSLFGNSKWNDIATDAFLLNPIFASVGGYRPWHFHHHRYVGTSLDPELKVKPTTLYTPPRTTGWFLR